MARPGRRNFAREAIEAREAAAAAAAAGVAAPEPPPAVQRGEGPRFRTTPEINITRGSMYDPPAVTNAPTAFQPPDVPPPPPLSPAPPSPPVFNPPAPPEVAAPVNEPAPKYADPKDWMPQDIAPTAAAPSQDSYRLLLELSQTKAALEAEKKARREEAERQAALAKKLDEYDRLQLEQDFVEQIKDDELGLASLDPADAKKLMKIVYDKMDSRLSAKVENEIKSKLNDYQTQQEQREKRSSIDDVRRQQRDFERRLNEAIPDLPKLVTTPAYQKYIKGPFYPGSQTSVEDLLNRELSVGNVDFVIGELKKFAASRPNPVHMAKVNVTTTGSTAPPPAPSETADNSAKLKELLDQRRSGRIRTNAEYRALKQKLKPSERV